MTNDIMTMLTQFKTNPMAFLLQRRMNIPQNISSDPNAILNHLLKTGQISQDQVNRAYQQMSQFRR